MSVNHVLEAENPVEAGSRVDRSRAGQSSPEKGGNVEAMVCAGDLGTIDAEPGRGRL
jgi:hypothetical protein